MSASSDLKNLINEIVNNKNAWSSNTLIGISRKLQEVENETGEDYNDFHTRIGRININNDGEHKDFQDLLREIRNSI